MEKVVFVGNKVASVGMGLSGKEEHERRRRRREVGRWREVELPQSG